MIKRHILDLNLRRGFCILKAMPDEAPSVLYFGISCEDMNCLFDSRSEEPRKCCMELFTYPNATSFGALIHAVSFR